MRIDNIACAVPSAHPALLVLPSVFIAQADLRFGLVAACPFHSQESALEPLIAKVSGDERFPQLRVLAVNDGLPDTAHL